MHGGPVADGELVVPSGHGPVPLEPVDPALHRVPLLVQRRVEGRRPATAAAPGPPVGGLVVQHPVGPGTGTAALGTKPRHPDAAQHRRELRAVTGLPGGQHDRQGALALLDRQVQLAAQSAPRAPKGVVGRLDVDSARFFALPLPPLRAPAACWWARMTVVSMLTSQVISPRASAWACRRVRICCQVPSRCQRRNSPYTVCQGPYRAGTSRHGAPVRVRQRIPLMSWRLLQVGGRPAFLPLGSNGSSLAHCSLVRSPRPMPGASHESIPLLKQALVLEPVRGEPHPAPLAVYAGNQLLATIAS